MINIFSIMSFGLNLVILLVSACCFVKIMKNDLIHLQRDLQELKNNDKRVFSKIDKLGERISRIEGRLDVKK